MTILKRDLAKTFIVNTLNLNFGKIHTGFRNILTESFDPLQKLTTVHGPGIGAGGVKPHGSHLNTHYSAADSTIFSQYHTVVGEGLKKLVLVFVDISL